MSPREKLNPNKTQRTRIEDIPPLGEELSEERLGLVSGGIVTLTRFPIRLGGAKKTHYPSTSQDPIKDDVDTSNPSVDSLFSGF